MPGQGHSFLLVGDLPHAHVSREACVVNWLSDSVSIVDLTTGNVTRSFDVGDEPTDVLFAGTGNNRAFVCVSGGGRTTVGFSQITGGTGAIKIFDATNPLSTPVTIEDFAKQPRALARNADGSRVFVSFFESGNQTTIVPEATVGANGGLPPPNPAIRPGLPVQPNTGLIVKWDGSNWRDEINRSWNAQIPFTLADVGRSGQVARLGVAWRGVRQPGAARESTCASW